MNSVKRPRSKYRIVFDVYKDAAGEWRWRAWSKNGRVIADSGEGYKRRSNAVKACERMQDDAAQSTIFCEGKDIG